MGWIFSPANKPLMTDQVDAQTAAAAVRLLLAYVTNDLDAYSQVVADLGDNLERWMSLTDHMVFLFGTLLGLKLGEDAAIEYAQDNAAYWLDRAAQETP